MNIKYFDQINQEIKQRNCCPVNQLINFSEYLKYYCVYKGQALICSDMYCSSPEYSRVLGTV